MSDGSGGWRAARDSPTSLLWSSPRCAPPPGSMRSHPPGLACLATAPVSIQYSGPPPRSYSKLILCCTSRRGGAARSFYANEVTIPHITKLCRMSPRPHHTVWSSASRNAMMSSNNPVLSPLVQQQTQHRSVLFIAIPGFTPAAGINREVRLFSLEIIRTEQTTGRLQQCSGFARMGGCRMEVGCTQLEVVFISSFLKYLCGAGR